MSQISIIFQKNEKPLFLSFWNKFERDISGFYNICIGNTEETIDLNFEIKDRKCDLIKARLCKDLMESAVLFYKEQYFDLHIGEGFSSKIERQALIRALAVFDKAYDINYALKNMAIDEKVNIRSYFQFRLAEIKLRWQEIAGLFQENLAYLLASDSCVELIRNLIEITENDIESVFVNSFENYIFIRDKNGVELCPPISVLSSEFLDEVVLQIIPLAPKSIYLSENKDRYLGLENKLRYIFDKKVVVNAWQIGVKVVKFDCILINPFETRLLDTGRR